MIYLKEIIHFFPSINPIYSFIFLLKLIQSPDGALEKVSSQFRFALLRCSRLLSDEINQLLLQHDHNYSLWQSLVILKLKQQCTALEIANELRISKPAINKRISTLVDLNMIELSHLPDRRQKQISMTEFGLQKFDQICLEIDVLEKRLLESFNQSELNQTHDVLRNLLTVLEQRRESNHE